MVVDENRIPEVHFPGEEVTFYGRLFFSVSYSLASFVA